MKKYINNTKQNLSFSLNAAGQVSDHIIPPGESAELPSDNAYVQSLAAQGIIVETEVKPKTEKK